MLFIFMKLDKWHRHCIYHIRFFIGYWIKNGARFLSQPFFFAPGLPLQKNFESEHCSGSCPQPSLPGYAPGTKNHICY